MSITNQSFSFTKNLKKTTMKRFFSFLLILSVIFLNSCSTDDDQAPEDPAIPATTNGFNFSNVFFETTNISIEERELSNTTLNQYNINLTDYDFENAEGIDISSATRVSIILQAADLSPKTITTGLTNYMITANISGNTNGDSTPILVNNGSNLSLDSFEIIITSSTSSSINMNYRFIRQDGSVFNGAYSGDYTLRDR